MLAAHTKKFHFCGQPVSAQELEVIKSVISDCAGISRTELASTLCEIMDWRRQNCKLKTVECRAFLEELDVKSILQLPVRRQCGRARGSRTFAAGYDFEETVFFGKKSELDPID